MAITTETVEPVKVKLPKLRQIVALVLLVFGILVISLIPAMPLTMIAVATSTIAIVLVSGLPKTDRRIIMLTTGFVTIACCVLTIFSPIAFSFDTSPKGEQGISSNQ